MGQFGGGPLGPKGGSSRSCRRSAAIAGRRRPGTIDHRPVRPRRRAASKRAQGRGGRERLTGQRGGRLARRRARVGPAPPGRSPLTPVDLQVPGPRAATDATPRLGTYEPARRPRRGPRTSSPRRAGRPARNRAREATERPERTPHDLHNSATAPAQPSILMHPQLKNGPFGAGTASTPGSTERRWT